MQGFITPDLPTLIKRKSKKVPGRLLAVSEMAGMSRSTMYSRLSTGNFTLEELKALDRILHFTPKEKEVIWR